MFMWAESVASRGSHEIGSCILKYLQFMILGHSYLPNNRDFGSIEKANRRNQHVFIPEEWCTLVENVRTKNPLSGCPDEPRRFCINKECEV